MGESAAVAGLVAEKRKLKKSLFRFDMIFFTVCAIVALDTIGQSSSYGAQAVFWLIVSALTFLVPYGLITAELGAAFPTEGATYDWVRLAYGHFAGAVVSVLYWLSNPIWLGGTLTATTIAALDALWGSQLNGQQGWETVIGFFFIWGAVTMNILSLRYMKWVPNLGAIVRLALLAFFALLVVVAGLAFVFVLLSSGTTWLMGSDRLMAIGALAGSGPKQLGYFSGTFGTPIVVNVLSGVISTVFMIITFYVTGGGLHSFFAAVLGLVISTTTFSYILIFPALITLRRKYPNVRRPFVIPGGNAGAWACVILATLWVLFATVFSIWPGLFTSAWNGDYAGVSRTTFELYNIIAIVFLLGLALVFWAVGRGHAINTQPGEGVVGIAPMPAGATGQQ